MKLRTRKKQPFASVSCTESASLLNTECTRQRKEVKQNIPSFRYYKAVRSLTCSKTITVQSIPSLTAKCGVKVCARLAQLVRSLTANQEVPGSIPGLVEG